MSLTTKNLNPNLKDISEPKDKNINLVPENKSTIQKSQNNYFDDITDYSYSQIPEKLNNIDKNEFRIKENSNNIKKRPFINEKNISLNKFRKEKEGEIDRESIFSTRNNLMDFNNINQCFYKNSDSKSYYNLNNNAFYTNNNFYLNNFEVKKSAEIFNNNFNKMMNNNIKKDFSNVIDSYTNDKENIKVIIFFVKQDF